MMGVGMPGMNMGGMVGGPGPSNPGGVSAINHENSINQEIMTIPQNILNVLKIELGFGDKDLGSFSMNEKVCQLFFLFPSHLFFWRLNHTLHAYICVHSSVFFFLYFMIYIFLSRIGSWLIGGRKFRQMENLGKCKLLVHRLNSRKDQECPNSPNKESNAAVRLLEKRLVDL